MTRKRHPILYLMLAAVAFLVLVVGGAFSWLAWQRFGPTPRLEGGTRLVYRLDLDEALAQGWIGPDAHEDPGEVQRQCIELLALRLDPGGRAGVRVASFESDGILVELPAESARPDEASRLPLASDLAADDVSLSVVLSVPEELDVLNTFPDHWGQLTIGEESIRYRLRAGTTFHGLERGCDGTQAAAHQADRSVRRIGLCAIRNRIERRGGFRLAIVAEDTAGETAAASEDDGSGQGLFPCVQLNLTSLGTSGYLHLVGRPLQLIEEQGASRFDGGDLHSVFKSEGALGDPAVGLSLREDRAQDFNRWTTANDGREMALVMDGEALVVAKIRGPLPRDIIVEGGKYGSTEAAVIQMVNVLRAGSLPVRPVFVREERIVSDQP